MSETRVQTIVSLFEFHLTSKDGSILQLAILTVTGPVVGEECIDLLTLSKMRLYVSETPMQTIVYLFEFCRDKKIDHTCSNICNKYVQRLPYKRRGLTDSTYYAALVWPGTIPKELGALSKLKKLWLNNNQLTGEGVILLWDSTRETSYLGCLLERLHRPRTP